MSPNMSAASDEPRASCRLFPGLTVNYFERILREKVRPWLMRECAKNPDARSDMGTVDIARVRTHSFRRGPVTWLKDYVKSDIVVGGVAGMRAHRVRSCYDELSEKRVKAAQAHLIPYVTCTSGWCYESDMPDAICIVEESDPEEEVIIIRSATESDEFDESAEESMDGSCEVIDTTDDDAEDTMMACPALSKSGRQNRQVLSGVRRLVREEVREAFAGLRSNFLSEPSRARNPCRVR